MIGKSQYRALSDMMDMEPISIPDVPAHFQPDMVECNGTIAATYQNFHMSINGSGDRDKELLRKNLWLAVYYDLVGEKL